MVICGGALSLLDAFFEGHLARSLPFALFSMMFGGLLTIRRVPTMVARSAGRADGSFLTLYLNQQSDHKSYAGHDREPMGNITQPVKVCANLDCPIRSRTGCRIDHSGCRQQY
jgi:hypothetical protein